MLTLIPPADLHACWPHVRYALEKCLSKAGGEYLPEDIYHRIKSGTYHLFAMEDFGYCVLEQASDARGRFLFVVAMWCEPHSASGIEEEICAALDAKRLEIGGHSVRMTSQRAGWAKHPAWVPKMTVYELQR